jgi:hypothetical protein
MKTDGSGLAPTITIHDPKFMVCRGETNFAPRGDSPSWTFAKIVDAHYGYKGLWKFITDDKLENIKIDQLFKDALARLESGEKVSLWDGRSTTISPSCAHISKVRTAHIKFRFFAGIPHDFTPVPCDDLERRFAALKKSNPEPLLARSPPSMICGVKKVEPLERRIDDLEERMKRLLEPPNEVVYASHV